MGEKDPKDRKRNRGSDKFPAPAEFRDQVSCPIGHGEASIFLFVGVARNAMPQEIVRPTQAMGQRGQDPECDVGIFAQEGTKIVSR